MKLTKKLKIEKCQLEIKTLHWQKGRPEERDQIYVCHPCLEHVLCDQ